MFDWLIVIGDVVSTAIYNILGVSNKQDEVRVKDILPDNDPAKKKLEDIADK